jgi:ribosomal protein S18 acetylase RimI-like enzyme
VLEQSAGLSSRALPAIADLERRVVDADGGRLKLEWGALRGRAGDRVEDLLWWEGDRLLGFLGIYEFGLPAELAGMVAPDARRRGIGTALLDAAVRLCRERGVRSALLIVPRTSVAGRRLAVRRGAVLDHSEHALELSGEPTHAAPLAGLALRPATSADLPFVVGLLEVAFGEAGQEDLVRRLDSPGSPRERTMVVELAGAMVGTLRLTRDGDDGGIFGFAVEPGRQGEGIGRAALRRACELLRSEGARQIRLEVDVENDRALGLYTSVGFTPVSTDDYFALPIV